MAAVGGATALGGGWLGARAVAPAGTVDGRLIVGTRVDDGTLVDETPIFTEYDDPDGPTERNVDSDYGDVFPEESPVTVSRSLHRRLADDFDEVNYYVRHDCPDARCSTPEIGRQAFNDLRLGDRVRLLYGPGVRAYVVP